MRCVFVISLLLEIFVFASFISNAKGELRCKNGWKLYRQGGTCLMLMESPKIQDVARSTCNKYHGDLVKIDSAAKQNFVFDYVKEVHFAPVWIGLRRSKDKDKKFKWLDESKPVSGFTNWDKNEPNNWNSIENCAQMMTNGFWNDVQCTVKFSYVCESDAFLDSIIQCPLGWHLHESTCYKAFTTPKNWNDAQLTCLVEKATLAVPEDSGTNAYLGKQLRHESLAWIGITDKITEGKWLDTQSTAIEYTNWGDVLYNNKKKNCGGISQSPSAKWTSLACSDAYDFICQKRAKHFDIHCDTNWDLLTDVMMCVQRSHFKMKWDDAKKSCDRRNGVLPIITNDNMDTYLHSYLKYSPGAHWIGLHEDKSTHRMTWLHAVSAATYMKFDKDGFTPKATGLSCGTIDGRKQFWGFSDCNTRLNFFCLKPAYVVECPQGYTTYTEGETCFKVMHVAKEWEKARQDCQQTGGDLVQIRDKFTNEFLKKMIGIQKNSFWIGLNDRAQENKFSWLDETNPTLFTAWNSREPNNFDGKENCVQLVNNLKWNDNNCMVRLQYICEQKATVATKRNPKRTNPNVYCPEGWTRFDSKNTCVQFFRDRKTWEGARRACKSHGGDLVKITDAKFDKSINDLVAKSGVPNAEPYIGLSDTASKSHYRWLDETTDAPYFNWYTNEPSGGIEHCVVIVSAASYNYRWNDVDCLNHKPYICQQAPKPPGTLNCGTGWEDGVDTDFCYRFNPSPLSWLDAGDSCTLYGGNLVSISDPKEMLYLAGRLQGLKVKAQAYWSGGNDRATERGWTWNDRAPFGFFNWANGQPYNNHKENCISIDKKSGRWSAVSCEKRLPSICKKLGNTINYPTPRPSAPPRYVPKNKMWGCPSSWEAYRGSCYLVLRSQTGINWDKANDACRLRSSDLVAITDAEENKFVYSLFTKGVGSGVWIGLNDRQRKFSFSWSDNKTPVTYTNWAVGEPNAASRNELCGQMVGNGYWDDNGCFTLKTHFVCKQNKKIRDKSELALSKGCKKYGIGYQNKCYQFFASKKTFSDAENKCKASGGDLGTVTDRFFQAFLSAELFGLGGESYWIGLKTVKTNGESSNNVPYEFKWQQTGTSVGFTYWDRTYNGAKDNMCVAMLTEQPPGLWHAYPCSQTKRFICEYPRPGFTSAAPITTTTTLLPCPSGFVGIGHLCYKFNTAYKDKLSWIAAKSRCSQIASGGTLVSITSAGLSDRLKKEMKRKYYRDAIWIGLNDRDREGGYEWTDSQSFLFQKWAVGEPNDYSGKEDCVEWKFNSDTWNDMNCYKAQNYICQAPRGAQLLTTQVPPSIGSTVSVCGSGKWTMYNKYCYRVIKYANNWFDAENYCLNNGAHLVSLHNEEESGYLSVLMQKKSISQVWIGFSNFDEDVYKWTDRTPQDYFSWERGEPNDSGLGERCAALKSEGWWNDLNCADKKSYICKKTPGSNSPITPIPMSPPEGGCPAQFHGVPGTRQCYHLGGVLEKDRKNFNDAVKACKALQTNARMASIHSSFDEKFVTTLIAGLSSSVWIGFKNRYGHYIWQDNTKIDYTHWGPNQPVGNYWISSKRCTDMSIKPKTAGDWQNDECNNRFPYVCEYRKSTLFNQIPISSLGCPQHYSSFRQSCYLYKNDFKSWSESEASCVQDGGHLVSIQDQFEQSFVELLMDPSDEFTSWIGLSDNVGKNTFSWSDNWPILYTKWDIKQPDLENKCVVNTLYRGWRTKDCTLVAPSVCEINNAPLVPPAPSAPGKCPSNIWIQYGDDCYFLEAKTLRSWPEAQQVCTMFGANLASSHSATDADVIFKIIGMERTDTWIGLHSMDAEYTWSDKSEAEYWHWESGYPTQPNATDIQKQRCVIVQGFDGKWVDVDCIKEMHSYLCKMKQIPLNSAVTSSSTQSSRSPIAAAKVASKTESATPRLATKPQHIGTHPPHRVVTHRSKNFNQKQSSASSSGMSSGGIAGIVLGILIVGVAASLLVTFLRKQKNRNLGALSYENAVYNNSNEESPSVQFPSSSSA